MATCALCCDEARAWVVGVCDHAVCLLCSVRLRVLCDQRECPVCREKLDKVVVTDSIKPFSPPPYGLKADRKHGMFFEKPHLYDKYKSLQQNRCSKCRDKPIFRTFSLLREHCRKTHGLNYCDICTDNLKLFPGEFRQYTRQEMTRHRREGDLDDKSYKGHPLCQFCDDRFLDNDTLHAHLRKAHFWCHFCESEGRQDYYCNYPLLRNHFRSLHFMCEEGPCQQEKFTSVFRSKLDLQAHRATVHTKGVSKAEAKQMRQLDVGFVYTRTEELPRTGGVVSGTGSRVGGGGRSQWQQVQRGRTSKTGNREREELEMAAALSESMQPPPQREGKSPQSRRKARSTAGSDKPSSSYSSYEQPPRLKQRQEKRRGQDIDRELCEEQREDVVEKDSSKDSRNNTDTTTPEVKKPPGFESTQPSATVNSDLSSEWPDLMSLTVAEAPLQQRLPTVITSSAKMLPLQVRRTPVVNYNPLEPSNFPSLSSAASATYPNNSNLALLGQPPNSTANSGGMGIPPGFVPPGWQQIRQDPIYSQSTTIAISSNPVTTSTSNSVSNVATPSRSKEEYVIGQVRQALNYDREKFNLFRNLSGWYRNSEITVQEYVRRCRILFGEGMWMAVGPQLAEVMPIEGKRNELIQNLSPVSGLSSALTNLPSLSAFPPPGTASFLPVLSEDPQQQRNRQARWGEDRRSGVPNRQSEREYPTLHSRPGAGMTGQPSGMVHTWKSRVQV